MRQITIVKGREEWVFYGQCFYGVELNGTRGYIYFRTIKKEGDVVIGEYSLMNPNTINSGDKLLKTDSSLENLVRRYIKEGADVVELASYSDLFRWLSYSITVYKFQEIKLGCKDGFSEPINNIKHYGALIGFNKYYIAFDENSCTYKLYYAQGDTINRKGYSYPSNVDYSSLEELIKFIINSGNKVYVFDIPTSLYKWLSE